ncbi:MAG: universal stress protein [Deltaproteobacteria bacterium]|nr:universal stress protein [Deltaproteobacteria bacterium]
MGTFDRILVSVDGSRHSLDAVCLAARLAKIHDSALVILHVIDETLLDQLSRFSQKNRDAVREELRNSARGFLDDMKCEASKELVGTIEVSIKEGVPHEEILKEASAWRMDLIIMENSAGEESPTFSSAASPSG